MLDRKSPLTYEEIILQKQLEETDKAIKRIAEEKSRKEAEEKADWIDANYPFINQIKIGDDNWIEVNNFGDMDCYE